MSSILTLHFHISLSLTFISLCLICPLAYCNRLASLLSQPSLPLAAGFPFCPLLFLSGPSWLALPTLQHFMVDVCHSPNNPATKAATQYPLHQNSSLKEIYRAITHLRRHRRFTTVRRAEHFLYLKEKKINQRPVKHNWKMSVRQYCEYYLKPNIY